MIILILQMSSLRHFMNLLRNERCGIQAQSDWCPLAYSLHKHKVIGGGIREAL